MINLPPLEIPVLPLPIAIPELIHPMVIHCAIALPVIVLLIELFNTLFKKRALSVTSLMLLLLMSISLFVAYLTGSVDAKNLSGLVGDAKALLEEHKQIGIYMVYGSAIVIFFKLLSMITKAGFIRLLYVLVLIGFIVTTLYQSKEGMNLVYKYGSSVAPVQKLSKEIVDIKKDKTKTQIQIKELEDKISTLEAKSKETQTLKDTNEQLKTQIDTIKTKADETKKSLEDKINSIKSEAQKTKESLETQITTLKEKASKVVEVTKDVVEKKVEEVVTTNSSSTTDTNSSAE